MIFEYEGALYPDFIKHGNAQQYIAPIAKKFCVGVGLDVCSGQWPLPGARPIDLSHGLEHLPDPVGALEHWKTRIRPGGVLFLYLPSHEMRYWQTTKNRKHLHEWQPQQMARIVRDLGFVDVLYSERDLAWSFAVCGWNGRENV
jgi:hypothetical protein